MPKCKYIKKEIRLVETGSMNNRITIYNRQIEAPLNLSVEEYNEIFTNGRDFWANVVSVSGLTLFDSASIERIMTHEITMRYIPDYIITAENWVAYKNNYLRIINVEMFDFEEIANRFIKFSCVELGTTAYKVNYA